MNDMVDGPKKAAQLRWRAEEAARKKAIPPADIPGDLSPQDMKQLIHDLRVHQIELEMQNEELRRAQVELSAARERHFDLYDLAPVGYCIISQEGLILEANLTVVTLLGIARAALIKQPITRFIFKEDQDTYYLHRRKFLQTGEPNACDLRMLRKDGTAFWARLTATHAQEASPSQGQATDAAPVSRLVLTDISERRKVEEALTRSELLLHSTQQLAHVGSWELDVQKQTTVWTEEMYHLYGLKRGRPVPGPEAIARSLECYLPEDRTVIQAAFQRCVEEGEPYDMEFRITTGKGRQVWIRTIANPALENGKVVRVTGLVMDITERRLKTGQGKARKPSAGT